MKFSLPGVLVGLGGVGGVAGAVVGVTYHGSEVEESRKIDTEFEKLREEIKKFADACKDQEKEGEQTILERLEDIFKILLLLQEDDGFLKNQKSEFENHLESAKGSEDKKKELEELYKKMKKFSKSLGNNQEKFSEYKNKLESESVSSSVDRH